MPRQPKFKLFATTKSGDVFGWMNKGRRREYTPKTAIRYNVRELVFKRK